MSQGDPRAWPPQQPAEYRPPTDADVPARLRRAYTRYGWGILHDGRGTWIGVHSPGPDIIKNHPAALRAAIDADARTHPDPSGHALEHTFPALRATGYQGEQIRTTRRPNT